MTSTAAAVTETPQDNHYAQIAYDYTRAHVSPQFAAWMATLATERRETINGVELHLVHGSPLGLNDFFWESLPEAELSRRVAASGADVVLCTHSGLPWQRQVDQTLIVNVGVLGRPANDGARQVWYAVIDLTDGHAQVELVPLAYDWAAQAASMRAAGLPETFVETIETGWWTSCLQILPPFERSQGRFQVYRSELSPGEDHDDMGDEPDAEPPGRPVVALFGSALFPRRLWILDSHLDERALAEITDDATAEGFLEVRTTGTVPPKNDGGLRPPELTLGPDGWYWDRHLSLKVAETNVGLREAKRRVVEHVLAQRQAEGHLPRSYGCVPAPPRATRGSSTSPGDAR
ncbi:MAG: metallophosphoesterase family protein [Acidimicrobiales bacterium]